MISRVVIRKLFTHPWAFVVFVFHLNPSKIENTAAANENPVPRMLAAASLGRAVWIANIKTKQTRKYPRAVNPIPTTT